MQRANKPNVYTTIKSFGHAFSWVFENLRAICTLFIKSFHFEDLKNTTSVISAIFIGFVHSFNALGTWVTSHENRKTAICTLTLRPCRQSGVKTKCLLFANSALISITHKTSLFFPLVIFHNLFFCLPFLFLTVLCSWVLNLMQFLTIYASFSNFSSCINLTKTLWMIMFISCFNTQ